MSDEVGVSRPMRVPWSVNALVLAAADALAARFGACSVQGELVGFSRASSGHAYFVLRDGAEAAGAPASLRCVMFRRASALVGFMPRDGQRVELRGRLAVYEARGELQFIVESMQALGTGSLYEEYLRSKARLAQLGLFDASVKRPLPKFPARIGVITSPGGAAVHDVLSTLRRRAPQVAVVLYPSLVQGPDAPAQLVAALARAAERREVDLLILTRGGGSLEDLWSFNDERVVRAIAASPIPVVCGVGHETDVTLADFAADVRAATPTAAAELAAPSQAEALAQLAALAARARRQVRRRIDSDAQRLDQRALLLARPSQLLVRQARQLIALDGRRRQSLNQALQHARQAPVHLARRLDRAAIRHVERSCAAVQALHARLQALDPKRVLRRGYAWVVDTDDRPIVSASGLRVGQVVQAVWSDGSASATLQQVRLEPDGD